MLTIILVIWTVAQVICVAGLARTMTRLPPNAVARIEEQPWLYYVIAAGFIFWPAGLVYNAYTRLFPVAS